MFTTPNVHAGVAGMRLTRRETSDGDPLTLAETNITIEPWPYDLLRELGPEACAHVFLASREIRPELRHVQIRPVAGALQRFTLRSAIGAGADVLEPVVVEWIKFTRREKPKDDKVWIKGVIRVSFEYRDKAVREFFAKRFGQMVFLSTEALEGRLDFEAPPTARGKAIAKAALEQLAPAPDPEAGDVLDKGNVTPIRKPGKSDPDVH